MLSESIKPPTRLVVDSDGQIPALEDTAASEQGFTVIWETDNRAALKPRHRKDSNADRLVP